MDKINFEYSMYCMIIHYAPAQKLNAAKNAPLYQFSNSTL